MFNGEKIKQLEFEITKLAANNNKLEQLNQFKMERIKELERQNRDLIWILEEIGVQIEIQENMHNAIKHLNPTLDKPYFEYRLHLNKTITETDELNQIKFHIAKAMLEQQEKENSEE